MQNNNCNNNCKNNSCNHLTQGPPRFLPIRSSSRRGLPPPLRGGSSLSKESPVLPIPSYPALCREDTTSWNDGRPRTLRVRMYDRLCGPMLLLQSPPAPRTTSNRPLTRDVVCAAHHRQFTSPQHLATLVLRSGGSRPLDVRAAVSGHKRVTMRSGCSRALGVRGAASGKVIGKFSKSRYNVVKKF